MALSRNKIWLFARSIVGRQSNQGGVYQEFFIFISFIKWKYCYCMLVTELLQINN